MAIVIIAIFPVAAGTLLYFSGWKPATQVNNGELITPPRSVTDIKLQTMASQPTSFATLHGKWVMVYLDASSCPGICADRLYAMRQIHTSQGKEADRIKRVFIATEGEESTALQAPLQAALQTQSKLYPDMAIWTADATAWAKLIKAFALATTASNNRIYLVDPLGNVMMQYSPQVDPAGVRKDLSRLLSYSWTG
jgi:cytochrome oxidase Cu insertion factor (SCO1/SenC/PrrC family)